MDFKPLSEQNPRQKYHLYNETAKRLNILDFKPLSEQKEECNACNVPNMISDSKVLNVPNMISDSKVLNDENTVHDCN